MSRHCSPCTSSTSTCCVPARMRKSSSSSWLCSGTTTPGGSTPRITQKSAPGSFGPLMNSTVGPNTSVAVYGVPATTPRSTLARFWSDCIFVSLLLGKRDGRERAIGVIVGFRGKQPYSVVAVGICDLFVVVGPEQVGVAAGKRVRRKRPRHRVGPPAMRTAVSGRPARDDLDDEMFTPIGERGLI